MKKLIAVFLCLALLCLSVTAVCEEDLIGIWESDHEYMREKGLATEPELALFANGLGLKTIIEFCPGGEFSLYYVVEGPYTYTDSTVTMHFPDLISSALLYLSEGEVDPVISESQFKYTLTENELVLISQIEEEEDLFIILHRASGEEKELVGRWDITTTLDRDEYEAYTNGELYLIADEKGFVVFNGDGSFEIVEDVVYYIDISLTYTVEEGIINIFAGLLYDEPVELKYGFEDGRLMLTMGEYYFDGEEWVDNEETIYLKRVS